MLIGGSAFRSLMKTY